MVALAFALGVVAVDATSRIRRIEFVSEFRSGGVAPPSVDPESPTGYSLGRRMLILPRPGEDGHQWIIQTQTMLAEGRWRIRRVDYDNAPAGREVHWASLLRGWVGGLAWIDRPISGRPLGAAVEHAALWANPVLLVLLLLGVVPLVARRFGSAAAAVLAVGLAVTFPFNVNFGADAVDHHGIIAACGLLTVLLLLVGGGGLVRTAESWAEERDASATASVAWLPPVDSARRWFVASAVVGGVGIWVSAVSQIPVLVGVGLGAAWSAWLGRADGSSRGWRFEPRLWRWWGLAGAGVSLAAYALEYFPAHLGFRLEINHPLYALAWVGGGELLCRWFQVCGRQKRCPTRRDIAAGAIAAGAVAVAPIVILLTRENTFLVADRMLGVLSLEHIAEGKTLLRFFADRNFGPMAVGLALPLGLVALPIGALVGPGRDRVWKAQVALAFAPAVLFALLTLRMIRWWGPGAGLGLTALVPLLGGLARRGDSRRLLGWIVGGCAVAMLPGGIGLVQSALQPFAPSAGEVRQLAERDAAHWLRQRGGAEPVVVASTPVTTNHLIYHGGVQGLGTLYWENLDGLKKAAAFFAAPTPAEACAMARRFGVTHVVLPTWDTFGASLARLHRETVPEAAAASDTFIGFLLRGGVPPWLRLLPFRLPPLEAAAGHRMLVFEVTPAQPPVVAAAHLVQYLLEMDQPELATAAVRELEQHPSDLLAQVTLAYYHGQTGQGDAFVTRLERVLELAGQAPELELEDRIRFALVLAAGQQTEKARAELQQAMAQMDETELRRLTPRTAADLLTLTEALAVDFPDAGLRELGHTLYLSVGQR